jgi:quercetin dioxygenase-like cupin family protein
MRSKLALVTFLLGCLVTAPGADPADEVRVLHPRDVEWRQTAIEGAAIAPVAGDPTTGMHYSFLKMSKGCRIPPHWHSSDEVFTIVSGTAWLGVGDRVDASQAREYGPGTVVFMPAGARHYAWSEEECVVSQSRSGAVDFHWVVAQEERTREQQ